MKIEIWSDIVCPFCFIGKRHLDMALEQFEHSDDVEIILRSFELDPNNEAVDSDNLAEMISKKYGISMEQSVQSQEDVARRAESVGLHFNWREAKNGNTFNAHRLLHLAQEKGLGLEADEIFKLAYFSHGQAIGDTDTLRALANEVGLDKAEVDEVLNSDKYSQQVRTDESRAQQLGIQGVPFFLIEEKWALNGAQPVDTMKQALDQVWNELHPEQTPQFISVEGTDNAPSCGPNGC